MDFDQKRIQHHCSNFERAMHRKRPFTIALLSISLMIIGLSSTSVAQDSVKPALEDSKQYAHGTAPSINVDVKEKRFQVAQRATTRQRAQPSQSRPADPNREPGELGNPDIPQNLGGTDTPISVNFESAPLEEVVRSIGLQLGEVFIFGQGASVQTPVSIVAHKDLAPEYAMELLIIILDGYNLEIVRKLDGNVFVVQQKQTQKNNDKFPINIGPPVPHDGFDMKAIHVVQIQYANAQEVSEIIRSVGSGFEEINVFNPTNTLIIKDTADGIRNMFRLIESIDIPGYDIAVEFFTLNYTRAETVSQQIEDVLMGGAGGSQQPSRPNVARPSQVASARRTQNTPGQAQSRIVGSTEDTLRMVPDERLNALVVVATEALMDQVRFLIEKLDQDIPDESNNMHYVTLKNAKAEEVATALDLLSGTAPRQANQQNPNQQGEVQPFEKEVTIQAYEPDNSLIILASPQDFEALKSMIEKIDVPRRQVSIEAIIMEVTITDKFELDFELAGVTNDNYFGFSNVLNLANAVAGGPSAVAIGPGGRLGILDGETTVLIDGVETTVPNVPFFMRALETLSDVNVLFKPNLMTVNNEPSHLFSGQNIPLISGQSDVNPQSGFQSRNNIQRENIGVTLEVTPSINDGDKVSLELLISSEEVIQSTVGIDPNETGATTTNSEIETVVVVDNDQTAVIGGLIRDSRTKGFSQVPWLGDIPLIGNLFKARLNNFTKQNLIVLVTPHILRDTQDFETVKLKRLDDFYQNNLDEIFGEDGFVKKQKRKSSRRKNYRPVKNKELLSPAIDVESIGTEE